MATQSSEQDLQEQMKALRSDFSELTKTMKKLSEDYVNEGQSRLRQTADQARQQARDTADQAREQARNAAYQAQEGVENHPFSSVAVAFGIGLLIGKILDR
ncbi:hypothetical protein [Methylophaga sp.]|jgi:ElaB/YqjD/DUF883 family membrane-anchored ribosome-binding protein|uniref:DUF883 family protein n=1 Tax=Methylophaga sp. TaxID=2024840 RepID=UPI0013FE7206|nr:hypothetical protein [Methylophaga sp.]MTI63052.1 DUF883 domain-containing protein [Methylophaga sp.]